MPGKTVSPDAIAKAVVMRAAGYTVVAISDRLGVSVRSLYRHLARHSSIKGEATAELVDLAKRELVTSVTSNEEVKAEVARIVADDLAHAHLLRERIAMASEHLVAGKYKALSTAVKRPC